MSNIIRNNRTLGGTRQIQVGLPGAVPRSGASFSGEERGGTEAGFSPDPSSDRELLLAQLRAELAAEVQAAQRKAEAIRVTARKEAEQLRATAQAEGEQQGYQDGFAQGLEEARQCAQRAEICEEQCVKVNEARRRVDQALKSFNEAVAQLRERERETLEEAQQELIDIAFEMAAKVVQTEIQTHPETILANVQGALERFKGGDITLRLHPEDAETVQGAWIRLTEGLPRDTVISIKEDDSVERGGCLADGDGGRVDSQPSRKLELLHQAVGA